VFEPQDEIAAFIFWYGKVIQRQITLRATTKTFVFESRKDLVFYIFAEMVVQWISALVVLLASAGQDVISLAYAGLRETSCIELLFCIWLCNALLLFCLTGSDS